MNQQVINPYSNRVLIIKNESDLEDIEKRISSIVSDFNEKFKTMSHRIRPLETSTNHTVMMENIERLDNRIDASNTAETQNRQGMFDNLNSRLESIEAFIRNHK